MSIAFEKWQALGNDYVIVERDMLPFELTPARVRMICDVHRGIGGDGVLELAPHDEPGYVAALRIFNPDGSEAELSGNGAREAVLYLRHAGWTDQRQFSLETKAGEIRPTIIDDRTCSLDIGRARLRSDAYPSGSEDGRGVLTAGGRDWSFQHVNVGNPQCSIRVGDRAELAGLDIAAIGPAIERSELFPQRTNVSFYTATGSGSIVARIFERGAGETSSSGTGACGAAVAHALDGGDEEIIVTLDGGELAVTVDEALHVTLTGWAEPVYSGVMSSSFEQALLATDG